MRKIASTLLVVWFASAGQAFAFDFTPKAVQYTDAATMTVAETAAINMLSNLGIIHGNPDSTFAPRRLLNRAEFMKIAIQLHALHANETVASFSSDCFPDVRSGDWFASYVCTAKRLGIIQGNPDGLFHPERPVNLAEATKILVNIYGYKTVDLPAAPWYAKYENAANDHNVLIYGLTISTVLTRGQMARIAAAFEADKVGQLDLYRRVERGKSISSTSSANSVISTSSSSSSSSSLASSVPAVQIDPLHDSITQSQFVLLGETSPVLGTFSIFIEQEPFSVTSISVNLTTAVPGIDAILIYDQNRVFVGSARNDGATRYTLTLPTGSLHVDQKKERKFYVRAVMLSIHQGAVSDATIQIASVTVKGNGEWSTDPYQRVTTDTFPAFKTTRSMITAVRNAGISQDVLLSGTQRQLATFTFEGHRTDGTAIVKITDLAFEIGQSGGVTLSSVRLGADGVDFQQACSITGTTVMCSSIPAGYASLEDGPRTLTLYGDVTVPANAQHASLRLTLNQPGSVSTPGAVTWTDGSTSFSWVQFGSPVAEGTLYKF